MGFKMVKIYIFMAKIDPKNQNFTQKTQLPNKKYKHRLWYPALVI